MALSPRAIARLRVSLERRVEEGSLPGAAALVAHGPDVQVVVAGARSLGDPEPLPRDAIFRIASLTKPVAGVAAMILVEEGAIALEDPVDELLPELADRRVLRSVSSELDDTVPARRAIRIEDLLTFKMGFGAIMEPPATHPIQRAEEELGLMTLGPPWPPPPFGPDEWIRRLGTLPLMAQPGEHWMYNTGAQVLGVLIERAAEQPLETFMRERIFEPLEMGDTAFSVAAADLGRLTVSYDHDLSVRDGVEDSMWARPPQFPNAAGWLVSTIDDYWSFVRMLAAGGGEVLSQESVRTMTEDHLSAKQRAAAVPFLEEESSWGLCMSVPSLEAPPSARVGYGWDGGSGTTWRTDTRHDLTGILFTLRGMSSPEPPEVFVEFWDCAYEAMEQ